MIDRKDIKKSNDLINEIENLENTIKEVKSRNYENSIIQVNKIDRGWITVVSSYENIKIDFSEGIKKAILFDLNLELYNKKKQLSKLGVK